VVRWCFNIILTGLAEHYSHQVNTNLKINEESLELGMSDPLRCSIIVNTYNRVSFLEKLLASFNHIEYDAFEVVVVNGPSIDGTAAFLESYSGRIKVANCPEANLSLSRNIGIAEAAGEIIVFIDDDALPSDTKWLSRMVRAFQHDKSGRLRGAGGPVLHKDTDNYAFKGGVTSDYGMQIFLEEELSGETIDGIRWIQGVAGGNCGFYRSTLQEIGGFDENFVYYLDETDVCLRMSRRGYEIVYIDDCSVRHYPPHSARGSQFLHKRRMVARSDTYFSLKNGADFLVKRLIKTILLAPKKHFVQEIPELLRNRQISISDLIRLVVGWIYGFIEGLALGLLAKRRNSLSSAPPPPFKPFRKNIPRRKFFICLLSRFFPPDPHIGGIARYTHDLAHGLQELGHEVHVITSSEELIRRECLGLTIHGISPVEEAAIYLFPQKPTLCRLTSYSLAIQDKLIDLAHQGFTFDVIETPNWDVEGLILALENIYPTICRIHTPLAKVIETEYRETDDDMKFCVSAEKWLIEHVDGVTASTQGVIDTTKETMNIEIDKLPCFHKVPLGLKRIYPEPVNREGKFKRLLYVGRVERRKGTHVLLATLPQLMTQFDDWECFIVGHVSGSPGIDWITNFKRKYKREPWMERVHFVGAVSDEILQRFYQTCDVFVAPSLYESFGIIYMEAMQFGKPVVGCETGGVPEIVTNGVDGLLVEPGNVETLYEALHQLMENQTMREEMGVRGQNKVEQKFNNLVMAQGMLSLYRDAVKCANTQQNNREVIIPTINKDVVRTPGQWVIRKASTGRTYLFSDKANASLNFSANGGSSLRIITLRHDWSGVIEIDYDLDSPKIIDLYRDLLEPEFGFAIDLPGISSDELNVSLTVSPERNPMSHGNEVWIRKVTVISP
jgi:glycosyltransferase involved in cell wall biosynthesis/GT2 family glycosyltransferase